VIELLLASAAKAAADPQAKAVLVGLPLVMHDVLAHGDEEVLFTAVKTHLENKGNAKQTDALLDFLSAWCLSGRSMSGTLLDSMQSFVQSQPDSAAKTQCLARLARARPRSPLPPNAWLGLGGLPKLLSGIEGSFQFGTVAESRLEDLPVWTIEGTWNRARLVQLLGDQKDTIEAGQAADLSKLAPNLPDRVVLHVGCDDFFPYRIEYWRAAAKSDAKAGVEDLGRMILLMELYEVRLGANINPQEFAFKRGAIKPIDRTQEFLDKFSLDDRLPEGAGQPRARRR
jgi:hypothetical protein